MANGKWEMGMRPPGRPFRANLIAFFFLFSISHLPCRPLSAVQVTGATLSNFNINSESLTTVGNSSGTVVQFTLDTAADVTVFIQDAVNTSSSTIATLTQNYASGGPQSIFWNGLWLIGNEGGRRNGNF